MGRGKQPLGASVRSYFEEVGRPEGLPARCDDLELVFVPLCHPARPVNRFEGDYAALLRALDAAGGGGRS